jgi:site-specific DNA recombinase
MSKRKAVAYARFSSSKQREESIVHQLEKVKAYCSENSIELVDEYIDEAQSGTTDRRISFQRMIADAENSDWNYIIVYKHDRLSRSVGDALHYKKYLQKLGIQIISVIEDFDTDTPEGGFFNLISMGMSEFYVRNLKRETFAGIMQNAKRGMATGGIPPFGYDIDKDKKFVINEHEAKGAKLIFEWALEGVGYREIAKRLNEMGYKNKLGNPFRGVFYDLLRNRKYIGEFFYNRSEAKREDGKRNNHKSKNESEIIRIPNAIPAIIDKDVFDKVQVMLDMRKQGGTFPRRTGKYLLTGVLKCKNCGYAMNANTKYSGRAKAPYLTYFCHAKHYKKCTTKEINLTYLDHHVMKYLTQELVNKVKLKDLQTSFNQTILEFIDKTKQEVEVIKENQKVSDQEVSTITEQLKTANKMLAAALISDLREIQNLYYESEIELGRLESDLIKASKVTLESLGSNLREVTKKLKDKDHSERRSVIRKIIHRIIVDNNGVLIRVDIRPLTGMNTIRPIIIEKYISRKEIYE